MGNLCCITSSVPADELEKAPSLTLERILTVFLLCFEAAIDSLPFVPPIPSTTLQIPAGHLPWLYPPLEVWQFTRDRSASPTRGPYDLEGLPASYRKVHAALRKTNMCDHFCFFLEGPLRSKLADSGFGTVRWMSFNPRPLAFYTEVMPNQDHSSSHLENLDEEPLPIHSVLEIKTTSGEEFIFDGTPEQFGWNDSAWTQDKEYVETYYVEGQTGMWEYDDHEKETLKQLVLETDPRPWGRLYKEMTELSEELDWDTLRSLDDETLWMSVRNQARRKFAI